MRSGWGSCIFCLGQGDGSKKKRSIGNSQGVEKRQEGRWFLTEGEVRGGGQLRSRGPTWQVVHNFLVKSLRKPIVCSQQTAKL